MKKLVLGLAFALAGATAASAQGVEFRAGPGGVSVGPERDRTTVIERRRGWDDDRVDVRRRREVITTGNTNCRTIVVRKEDDYGNRVTKRIRKCD
jgi:hypothetical protein